MSIGNVLLDAAASFKSSATHYGKAETSAVKALKAAADGNNSVAALHRSNGERALAASVRDAAAGQKLLAGSERLTWTNDGMQLLRDSKGAIDTLRRADSIVYQRGGGALVEPSGWQMSSGKPTQFTSATNARRELLGVAGDAHGLAVLPPT